MTNSTEGTSHEEAIPFDSDCIFCESTIETDDNHTYGLIPKSTLKSLKFFETNNFFLALDIAPIVPNHCLLVSRRHIPGFAYCSFDEIEEATEILERFTRSMNKSLLQTITIFEHSTPENDQMSCCINHAHIHILPLTVDFSAQIEKSGYKSLVISDYMEAIVNLQGKAYLFYQISSHPGCFYDATHMPSQYIRILYGKIRNQKIWNWHDRVFLVKNSDISNELTLAFNFLSHLEF